MDPGQRRGTSMDPSYSRTTPSLRRADSSQHSSSRSALVLVVPGTAAQAFRFVTLHKQRTLVTKLRWLISVLSLRASVEQGSADAAVTTAAVTRIEAGSRGGVGNNSVAITRVTVAAPEGGHSGQDS